MGNKRHVGLILAVLSSIFWSINAPLIKSLDLNAFLLVGMRSLIAGLALLPAVRLKRIKWNIHTFMMLAVFVIQVTCIVTALKLTAAPVAVGMQFTAPVWLYLMERKKGDPVSLKRIWPLLFLLSGIILFMCSGSGSSTLLGNFAALVTSFTFAAFTYFSKRLAGDNPVGMASLCNLFAALIVLGFIIKDPLASIAAISNNEWLLLIVLGVLQMGGGYACYALSLRSISAKTAAMVTPLEMILGVVWVAIFLHEIPDIISIIGFALITAGVLGEIWSGQKPVPSNQAAEISGGL
ncbi:MAG: EamA-like transporter family protein [Firmicutes bacterium ADurb.Bin182]|nr:MAG: EamA-like transporter family protein [Firmicutes bacterium ADurb.Bin182]